MGMTSQFPFGVELVAEGELPELTGSWDSGVPNNYQLSCKGIVHTNPGHADGGHGSCNDYAGFGFAISFGKGQLSNNIAPVYAVYRFKRVS